MPRIILEEVTEMVLLLLGNRIVAAAGGN